MSAVLKRISLLLPLLLIAFMVKGQLRYVKDMNQVKTGVTSSLQGIGGYFEYNYFLNRGLALGGNLDYEQSRIGTTDYEEFRFTGELKYNLKMWENAFINGYLGLAGEVMSLQSRVEDKSKNEVLFGNNVGVEFEYYVFKNIGITLRAGQRIFYIKSQTSYLNTRLGVSYSFY